MKSLRIPKQITASIVIMISSFIHGAINFITVPIFTRILSVAEYGVSAQYHSWLSVISVFATLSLNAGVYQVAMNEYPNDRNGFTFSALVLSNICTCVVFGIITIFYGFLEDIIQLDESLLIIMFVYLMCHPATSLWLARQRYEYNYIRVAVISVGSALLSQIIALLCISIVKNVNLGAVKVTAAALTRCIFALAIYLSIALKAKWKINFSYIKFALSFNLPLLLHYLAQHLLISSDKIMITRILGEEATGLYSLATTVANIAMALWSAMSASLTPYIYKKLNTREYSSVNKAVIGVEAIFAFGCILVAIIGPEVVLILGSQKYSNSINLIPPIAASSLLSAAYSFYSTIVFYKHKTKSTAIMTSIAAGLNIILNYIFIPRFGVIVAAYTTEITYLIYVLLHYLNYRKVVGKDRVYNDGFILGIVFITTVLCLFAGLLYQTIWIRYSIVAVILAICVVMRKRIFGLLKILSKKGI